MWNGSIRTVLYVREDDRLWNRARRVFDVGVVSWDAAIRADNLPERTSPVNVFAAIYAFFFSLTPFPPYLPAFSDLSAWLTMYETSSFNP